MRSATRSNSITAFLYTIVTYEEHALEKGSDSKAVSYVGIADRDGKVYWGAGVHTDIITSSIYALVSAVNRMMNS